MAHRVGPMEPGERDRFVMLQQKAEASGTSGFPVETWSNLGGVWMSKADIRGMERLQAMQMSAKYDTRWEMAYLASMDPELVDVPNLRRLVYQGRTYDIVSASQIGRREGVEVMTIAKVG
jgi:SPP1 family predicted phage head-tail adaptor